MSTDTLVARVSVDRVREAAERIVADDPDHVDPTTEKGIRPRYFANGKPNCLVGKILSALGFEDETLQQLDDEFPLGEILTPGIRITESRNQALARVTPQALALLGFLQDGQDDGIPWAVRLRAAFTKPALIPARLWETRRPWVSA
jgi:hypothetical protein